MVQRDGLVVDRGLHADRYATVSALTGGPRLWSCAGFVPPFCVGAVAHFQRIRTSIRFSVAAHQLWFYSLRVHLPAAAMVYQSVRPGGDAVIPDVGRRRRL